MQGYIYRSAEISDVQRLVFIENLCFVSDIISEKQFKHLILRGKVLFIVICKTEDTRPIGYGLCFTPAKRSTARLYSLVILPDFRGQRLALSLLELLLVRLQEKNYKFCNLEVRESDKKTQKLYEYFGFSIIKRIANYYQDGEAALRMRTAII